MFNRSEILRSAWSDYRRDRHTGIISRTGPFNRAHFAFCLRTRWEIAKALAAKAAAPKPAPLAPVVITDPLAIARIAEIRADLDWQTYGERIDWRHRNALRSELMQLEAGR